MDEEPRHKRLSDALCEAVQFGHPALIRIGREDWLALLHSLDRESMHKMRAPFDRFEDVPIRQEDDLTGCVVEHDNRYSGPSAECGPMTIPETVVLMRDTRKPAIVAW